MHGSFHIHGSDYEKSHEYINKILVHMFMALFTFMALLLFMVLFIIMPPGSGINTGRSTAHPIILLKPGETE